MSDSFHLSKPCIGSVSSGLPVVPHAPKGTVRNLILSAQGNTERVLQLSSKVLSCVTSELPWSLRALGHSRHKGGWVDFGDNLACYSQYPYSSWDRMWRKQFCLQCLDLILNETSCFPKEISMYPSRHTRIRRPELKNEIQSSTLTVYTLLWIYLLEDNRFELCPFFCYSWKTLLIQLICLKIIS